MNIPESLKQGTIKNILKHAEEGYPSEVCGVVVVTDKGVEKYIRCINLAKDSQEEFHMCPESFVKAEEIGSVVGIVHSHPDETTRPSSFDLAVMGRNRELELLVDPQSEAIPWHIVSWPEGDYRQIIPQVPVSLLGRDFVHNVWDCWATCEAYYKKYHDLEFPRFEREDRWWENKDAVSFYEKFYEECDFFKVESPTPGDLIIMEIGRTYHPNHAGVYLGDFKGEEFEGKAFYGNPLMLHHMWGKKSEVIVYGGQWLQRTRMILRHKSLGEKDNGS